MTTLQFLSKKLTKQKIKFKYSTRKCEKYNKKSKLFVLKDLKQTEMKREDKIFFCQKKKINNREICGKDIKDDLENFALSL